jgi:hypothetical protein
MRAPVRPSTRTLVALTVLVAGALTAGTANADVAPSAVTVFDARADAAPSSYCVDIPAVLIGQKICGGMLESTVTATSDPRGFALAGLAPVPKLSSVPLLIPNRIPVVGLPIPPQVTAALQQIKFDSTPSQCQALFPALNPGDDDRTCGGPSTGDAPLGFVGSGMNAHVQSSGDAQTPTSTVTTADSRVVSASFPGLQTTQKNVDAFAQSGENSKGVPTSTATVRTASTTVVGGLLTIDGILSTTTVAFDGTKEGTVAKTSFSYSGASVAGIPVDITKDGLVVSTKSVPLAAVNLATAQLNKLLHDKGGLTAELLPAPPIEVSPSQVRAQSGGILISYHGTTGTEITYSQLIGATSAQVGAVPNSADTAGGSSDGAAGGGTDGSSASGGGSGSSAGTPGGSTGEVSGPADLGGLVPSGSVPGTGDVAGAAPDPTLAGSVTTTTNGTSSQIGNQRLLRPLATVQLLPASRIKNIYPFFVLLLLGSLVISRGRRRQLFGEADDPTVAAAP